MNLRHSDLLFGAVGRLLRPAGWALIVWLLIGVGLHAQPNVIKVRIGVERNAVPISFVNEQGQLEGFTPELLRAMNGINGVTFEIVPGYWKELTEEFNAGRIDALANVIITESRRATMDFSVEHSYIHAIAYTRQDRNPVRRTAEFEGKVMGTLQESTAQVDAMEHNGWGARVVSYAKPHALLQAVQSGECDFALLLRPLRFEVPDELGLHREFVDDVLYKYHIAVHRGDRQMLERINEALATVRHNGTADRLYAKWIGPGEPQAVGMVDLRPYYLPIAAIVVLVVALFLWQQRINRRLELQARALHESEEKYRLLVEHTTEGIFVVQDGVFRFVNRALVQLSELEPEQLLGRSFLDFILPADRPSIVERTQQLMAGEIALNREEYQVVLPSGREFPLLTSSVRIDWQGRPATLSFVTDMSAFRQAERARREAAERLEKIANRVPGAVYQYRLCPDGNACFPYVSDGIEQIYRVRADDVRENIDKVLAVIHPDDLTMVRDSIAQSARDLTLWQLEYRVGFSDGTVRWLEGNASPQRETDGSVLWHGYVQDITERKAAANALRQEQLRLADIIRGTNVGTWEWNVQTGALVLNERWGGMLGYTLAELSPVSVETWRHLIHPTDLVKAMAQLEKHFRGELDYYECEIRLRHKAGHWVWILDTGRVSTWTKAGQPLLMSGTHQDIGARKQAEVELLESLQEKEALLKEVHHRVKNNLQVIMSLLRLEVAKGHDNAALAPLKEMQGRIRSMALLHETVYRSGSFARVNLADYLWQLVTQLFRAQNTSAGLIRLTLELAPVTVEMDQAIPCGLIVNELVTNSLKHGFPADRSGEVRVRMQQAPGGEVRLTVSDTGVGLPADFELERSQSLGLRIVGDLTKQLVGTLTIGEGASFTIDFTPAKNAAQEARSLRRGMDDTKPDQPPPAVS